MSQAKPFFENYNRYLIYKIGFISILPIFFFPSFVNAQQNSFNFEIDENNFLINYNFDGDVITMEIDPELSSLLIATENVNESQFIIEFTHELISAEKNEFAVLVNGVEVDYQIMVNEEKSTLIFYVPDYTEEIEIIGTHVIPEFPLAPLMILILITGFVIGCTKFAKPLVIR